MQNKNVLPCLPSQINEGTSNTKPCSTNVRSFGHSLSRCFLTTYYVPGTVLGIQDRAMVRTQVWSSSFSLVSLLWYGHLLPRCAYLPTFPESSAIRVDAGFQNLALFSLFVQISSAISNFWFRGGLISLGNLSYECASGWNPGLLNWCLFAFFSEFLILFLKGSTLLIWGSSVIQTSVSRLLDEVAHPGASWCRCSCLMQVLPHYHPFGGVFQDPKVLMTLQWWTVLCALRWYHSPIIGATCF